MSAQIVQEYVSIGGNRHTGASSWSARCGVLAFGADQNVAIWDPLDVRCIGIKQLLNGHKDKVTAVTFLPDVQRENVEYILSGSADGNVVSWGFDALRSRWHLLCHVAAHTGAVNCIATFAGSSFFVTGGADAKVKVWKKEGASIIEVLTILPRPKLIALSLVLGPLPGLSPQDAMFLAVGGTRNDMHIYALQGLSQNPTAEHQATLSGHEGWVHSLSAKLINEQELLIASASHDKYVRLWRFQPGDPNSSKKIADSDQIVSFEQTLSAKVQTVSVGTSKYFITFEALLLGHEDWVYSTAWDPAPGSEQLLTASADGTLTIWEPDSTSGIWISASRLGEISGLKGATTATGSSGGFWNGIWSPDGQSVTCLGRTGSWRVWHFDQTQQFWVVKHGISGHASSANGLTWSSSGDYLLSTSSDQTTRLHAEWKRDSARTWHEFARPQIHGYDLNCISSTGEHQFTSGADEKLLRVFNEPKDIAKMLKNLCRIEEPLRKDLSETAAMPVLGLSNKAMVDDDAETLVETDGGKGQDYVASDVSISVSNIEEPPTEDLLARYTLWPEHEKLYGHGYEISESAYSSSARILATTCKASSVDHAVIRLYDTQNWNEIKPPLAAHSLTVTRLQWSLPPDNYLLSVGRDRQWTVFKLDSTTRSLKLIQSNSKAHTRMILDAAWSPTSGKKFFATAGRDKTIKIWYNDLKAQLPDQFEEWLTVKRDSSVTALSLTCNSNETCAVLAVGEESGALSLHVLDIDRNLSLVRSIEVDRDVSPSRTITRVLWRLNPNNHQTAEGGVHLAIAAADGSVRILAINVEELCL